jgi:hypothetical protein
MAAISMSNIFQLDLPFRTDLMRMRLGDGDDEGGDDGNNNNNGDGNSLMIDDSLRHWNLEMLEEMGNQGPTHDASGNAEGLPPSS